MEAYGHETAWGYQYPVLEYVQANCSGHLTYITGARPAPLLNPGCALTPIYPPS